MRPLPASLAAFLALAACAEPYPVAPDLAASGADAPWPALVPVERITAQVPPAAPPRNTAGTVADAPLDTRAERLRARAERLRGPVIDPETERRMRRGVGG